MIYESLKIALKALKRNRGRTALTVLGIVIGISSVIAVMSAGEGMKGFVHDQVAAFGDNLIEVEIKVPSAGKTSTENATGIVMGVEITTLKLDDMEAILKLPNVKNAYGGVMGQQIVSYGGENKQAILMGVSSSFIEIDTSKVEFGRFFTADEDKSSANMVVIGPKIREKIFGDNDFLEKSIKIGRQKFRVIGAMEERGATMGFDMDDIIYIPIQTLQKKIMGIDHLTFIMTQVYDNSIIRQTAEEMTFLMREQHDITDPDKDDFHATSMEEAIEMMDTVFWAVSLLLIAIAGISLIVGGVGIMNIMYVSILERTYEIGLRKAIGATRGDILMQFLWEAIVVTFLGAITGVVFGVGLSWVISIGANSQGFPWKFVVLPSSLILASSIAIGIGLVFGVFPARTAAKMDPVNALRSGR